MSFNHFQFFRQDLLQVCENHNLRANYLMSLDFSKKTTPRKAATELGQRMFGPNNPLTEQLNFQT